jgi:aryl-alcohol dehydrogenase-like predicted oxidoreductase
MRYTRLGQTDLEVSKVCFGTWQFSGEWGSNEEQDLVDAPEIKNRREEVILATKGGLRMEGDQLLRDSSPDWLRRGVEDSLRYLGTDYIDLYQIHWPDLDTPFEETASTLDELVKEGKIRHVGVSNFGVDQMAGFEKTRKIESLQPPYHLFRRDIEEEILPYCREHGIGVLVYGPMAHGLLSGKMTPDQEFDEDDWRGQSDLFQGENFQKNLEKVEDLKKFAEERGHTVAQLAVAWTLANPAVDVAIVGARRPDHIEGTAPAAEFDLSEDDLREIESIMQGAAMVGGPSPEGV